MRTLCPNCHAELTATVSLEQYTPHPPTRLQPQGRPAVERVAQLILDHLQDGPLASAEVRRRITSRDRPHWDDALALLDQDGLIEITRTSRKTLLALA